MPKSDLSSAEAKMLALMSQSGSVSLHVEWKLDWERRASRVVLEGLVAKGLVFLDPPSTFTLTPKGLTEVLVMHRDGEA